MAQNESFSCLTCGFETTIDMADTSGTSDERAERRHAKFDGAHRPNWLTEADGEIYSPDELRTALGIEPQEVEW